MNESINEFIGIVVSLVLVVILLSTAIGIGNAGRGLSAQVNVATETRETLKEYRKYNAYDNKEVSGATAISLILELQGGDTGVEVSPALAPGGSTQYVGRLSSSRIFEPLNDELDNKFKPENLQMNILPTGKYMATLVYTANDTVGVVKFTKIP